MKNAKEVGSTGCIVAIVKIKYPEKIFKLFKKVLRFLLQAAICTLFMRHEARLSTINSKHHFFE